MALKGSCRCGTVGFELASHTPYPYMRCYCSICRKIAGGGGYAINIMGVTDSLDVTGAGALAEISIPKDDGTPSKMVRKFCGTCGSALWGWHPGYPELVHPFASAIDTDLPVPPSRTHIMLDFKASWVEPDIRDGDQTFPNYPEDSIETWHRARGLWIN